MQAFAVKAFVCGYFVDNFKTPCDVDTAAESSKQPAASLLIREGSRKIQQVCGSIWRGKV